MVEPQTVRDFSVCTIENLGIWENMILKGLWVQNMDNKH